MDPPFEHAKRMDGTTAVLERFIANSKRCTPIQGLLQVVCGIAMMCWDPYCCSNVHCPKASRRVVIPVLAPLTGRGGSPDGLSQQQRQQQVRRLGSRRGMLGRKASHRKYTQVKAEDMFRPEAKVNTCRTHPPKKQQQNM